MTDNDEATLTFEDEVKITESILLVRHESGDVPDYFTVNGLFGDKDNEQFNICQRAKKYCQDLFPYLYNQGESTPWRWKCSVRVPEDRVYVKENLVWLFNRVYKLNLSEKKPTPPPGYKHVHKRMGKVIEILSEIVKDDNVERHIDSQVLDEINNLKIGQHGLHDHVSDHDLRISSLENVLNVNSNDKAKNKRSKTDQEYDNLLNEDGSFSEFENRVHRISTGSSASSVDTQFIRLLREKFKNSVFFYTRVQDQSGMDSYCVVDVNITERFECNSDVKASKQDARTEAFEKLAAALETFYEVPVDPHHTDWELDTDSAASCSTDDSMFVSVYEQRANKLLNKYFKPNVNAMCREEITVREGRDHEADSVIKQSIFNQGKKFKDNCKKRAATTDYALASGAMKLAGRISNRVAIVAGKKGYTCTVSVNATKTLRSQGQTDNEAARNLLQSIDPDTDGMSVVSGMSTLFSNFDEEGDADFQNH
jgi:hypothetical protein